jgi:diguanylate cyclase (GGDEF)-like protein
LEDVCKEIERCSGTQFDPQMAQAFLKMLREGRLPDCSPDKDPSTISTETNMANILLQKVIESTGVLNETEKDKDGLTRVYNRSTGQELVDEYITEGSGCILVFDMESLRHVNNVHGMARGDLYLKTVAKLIDSVYEDKIVYRSSSHEFVCLLCQVTDPNALNIVVADFYQKLESKKAEDRTFDDMNVSIGAVFANLPNNNLEVLLFKADKALQEAKKQGPNNYCLYNSMKGDSTRNLSRIDLNNLIKEICNQGQYSNAYQVNYPEFVRNVNFIKKVLERNDQPMQIVMFTVAPVDDTSATLEQRDEVMEVMRKAVVSSLRSVDVTTPFSSSQRIVIFMNLAEENVELVMQRIVSNFYKMNVNKNFTLSYDIADLQ